MVAECGDQLVSALESIAEMSASRSDARVLGPEQPRVVVELVEHAESRREWWESADDRKAGRSAAGARQSSRIERRPARRHGVGSPVAWAAPSPCTHSLLVPGDDDLQPVAGIDDCVEERIVLHAGKAEKLTNARCLHAIEDVLRDRWVSVSGHRLIVTTVHRHDRTNRSEP